ncbi:MAG: hypothetical protein R2827_02950 [Bdellovibrionales bacterium]
MQKADMVMVKPALLSDTVDLKIQHCTCGSGHNVSGEYAYGEGGCKQNGWR